MRAYPDNVPPQDALRNVPSFAAAGAQSVVFAEERAAATPRHVCAGPTRTNKVAPGVVTVGRHRLSP